MRAGKSFRFDLAAADDADALAQATVVADRLLANPVIEESVVTVRPAGRQRLMAPRVGVVLFPGTNCEHDAVLCRRTAGADGGAGLARRHLGRRTTTRWSCPVGSPTATISARAPSPVSRRSWRRSSPSPADGGPVVGICNGFQVLTEAGLLPGALQKNRGLRFVCTTVVGPGRARRHAR